MVKDVPACSGNRRDVSFAVQPDEFRLCDSLGGQVGDSTGIRQGDGRKAPKVISDAFNNGNGGSYGVEALRVYGDGKQGIRISVYDVAGAQISCYVAGTPAHDPTPLSCRS